VNAEQNAFDSDHVDHDRDENEQLQWVEQRGPFRASDNRRNAGKQSIETGEIDVGRELATDVRQDLVKTRADHWQRNVVVAQHHLRDQEQTKEVKQFAVRKLWMMPG
jgi:hypothetical protein